MASIFRATELLVERRPDGDFKYMDPISHKYTGKPFPFRKPWEGWRS